MPLQEDLKSSTPFKSVDIKSMFLAASSRKRKASSPIPALNEAKSVKVCEKEIEEDIQIIDISDTAMVCASDAKENQDLNTVKNEEIFSESKDDFPKNDEKFSSKENECGVSSEDDLEKNSSEDLNSSQLNSSFNALNTSISETNPDSKPADILSNAKKEVPSEGAKEKNQNRKRKRMTPEEAKLKAEERDKKQKEQIQKKQELEAKKLQREREIQQRKFQKEMEKKAKEEEKKEKERLRLEKKEQEEKEKQMRLEEKESKQRMKQMALEHKLEMKKLKEEMKQKQEEERKKAEEEKKKAELEKEIKEKEKREKAKAAFVKFFKKENTSPPPSVQKSVEAESVFKPFQISEDMTLAPVVPSIAQERFNQKTLDAAMLSQCNEELYLQTLKSGSHCAVKNRKRQRKSRLYEADVMIVDGDQAELNLTAKLLQFSENVRPPYWGTWRKKSKNIRPRNPLGQDDIFDYSVDSDDEWEEGEPGESLSGTEPEDESEDDYEVDNEFMVPHGYLSAEEEKIEDENEQDDEVVNDPEKQKDLLKKKLQEFEMERKKKTTELKPIILGCYFENADNSQNNSLRLLLEPNAAVFLIDTPIPTSFTVKKLKNETKPNSNTSSPTSSSGSALKSKKISMPEEAMSHLVRLVHGNHHSLAFLIPEFQKFWQQHCLSSVQPEILSNVEKPNDKLIVESTNIPESPSTDSIISKRLLIKTIRQIASKGPIEGTKKNLWIVNENIREKYDLMDLPIPNTWCYLTTNNKEDVETSPVVKPASASIKEFLVP